MSSVKLKSDILREKARNMLVNLHSDTGKSRLEWVPSHERVEYGRDTLRSEYVKDPGQT